MSSRVIPHSTHAAVEVAGGAWIMVAPFVLGLGQAATIVSVLIGVLLISLAVQVSEPGRGIPLAAHASFDYALAAVSVIAGFAIGALAGDWRATIFLVGVGSAQAALTASTRWSAPAGA
jgi:hypothetical protein